MTSSNNERSRVKYQKRLVVVFLYHSWIILEQIQNMKPVQNENPEDADKQYKKMKLSS